MKVRIKKAVAELKEDVIIDIINIKFTDKGANELEIHYVRDNEYDYIFLKQEEVNKYFDFSYKEELFEEFVEDEAVWIREDEARKMIEKTREEGYREAERWKERFMKLIEKI